ncbi:MAG: hypothetical protein ABI396_19325 [Ktedonobacteraceae bacterium]
MLTQLEQEIASQPEVIARLLERETEHAAEIAGRLAPCHYAVIAARGSSWSVQLMIGLASFGSA